MPTAFTIGVRARRFGAAPPPDPTPGQTTAMAWQGEGTMAASVGGLGDNELAYNAGLVDWRGDNPLLTTTAGGPVSVATSGQGFTGNAFSNGTAANQAAHSLTEKSILLGASAANDPAGDFYAVPQVRDRYIANGSALGIVYLLIRSVGSRPEWDTTLMRIGRNNSSFLRQWGHAYGLQWLGPASGTLRIYREGATSSTYLQADLSGFEADEDIAIAWVLNDSRSSGSVSGASDNISRLFAKTRPGASRTNMGSAQTANTTTPVGDGTVLADLGRSRWANFANISGGCNNIRVHALGFDANPPITDAAIENNLDKLLARV